LIAHRARLLLPVAATLAVVAIPHVVSSQTPTPAPQQPVAAPLDEPLRILYEARQAYQGVRDYTCLFVKRERLKGQLQPENVMTMKVRTQPFAVYLRWQGPKNLEGQQACYVTGKNNGMMRAQSVGLLGMVGWVSLDPKDPRALENSRHAITEAGIGNLLARYIERLEIERKTGRTVVKVGEYEFNKRRCIRIETIHPDGKPGEFYSYRGVLYIDKELKLPVRVEAYDWPRQGGTPDGDLIECFSYVNLKLNAGVPDETFNH
jgi:hypothetical protein